MSKNLIIFDADSLCYLGGKEDTLQQVIEKVDYKINEILHETDADYYALLLSKGKYFRHELAKPKESSQTSYKAKRTYGTQIWVQTIKEYLIAQYGAVWYKDLEADDMAAWLMDKKLYYYPPQKNSIIEITNTITPCVTNKRNINLKEEQLNKILVAKDKDLLYSISGKHLNFSKKLDTDTWGMEWVETSEIEAYHFKIMQLLSGDSSDGVLGCAKLATKEYKTGAKKGQSYEAREGIKPKEVAAILQQYEPNQLLNVVIDEYIKMFGEAEGIFQFQKNYRLLHILTTNEDMLREVGYIPQLPTFQEVNKPEETVKIDF